MQKHSSSFRLSPVVFGASLVAASVIFSACSHDTVAPDAATVVGTSDSKAADDLIPGQYIVVLKDDAVSTSEVASYEGKVKKVKEMGQGILRGHGIRGEAIGHAYGKALKGFSASLSADEVAALRQDARVAYIEQDRIITLGKPASGGGGGSQPSQSTPYGIARVGTGDGTGKTAWIIDTGIDLDHPDLKVDVSRSVSFLTSGKGYASPDDGNGHGTHVSGTIAALNNSIGVVGVAAGATVVAVRVLDSRGSGSNSGVIAGVDYVGQNGKPGDVANMSLGGGVSTALDNAVLNASQGGVLFALAAGNESDDANNHSPARVNGANIFTVSAMDNTDKWAYFSNFGNPPVDYCMPGVNILSTWMGGGYNTISGTSMATPHMAGVLLMRGKSFSTQGTVSGDPDGKADPIAHL